MIAYLKPEFDNTQKERNQPKKIGDFYDKNKVHFFVRQCLLENRAVQKCIEKAIQDYKENMN